MSCILITGASSGIGMAAAALFRDAGYRVIVTARRNDRLLKLQHQLGDQCHAATMDITDPESIAAALRDLPKEFQEIDVLLNNAGLALGLEPAYKTAIENWERMIETNITGLLRVTRAVLPGMVERNRGHVINLGSIAGSYPYPGGNVYGATKAFLAQFTLNLKADLLGTNVRVTNIEPGMVETEFSVVRFGGDQAKADSVYQGMKPLSAEDIAEIALWCASRPAHVNINRVEVMPVEQAFSPFAVSRKS
ncbi:MAG: SDR family oxidoreductase [Alphaproteobacteria bacterium]|nr:SDR family oxidoreductase [Alphaproteobacteria bacterium]